ncbi:hypothetical protein N7471_011596 [Penicillium samsonianum]|uniref:uncharacterized protein n=1 Tax=Penicillium samsonianum TaxID=1882272 RepID=UPI002549471A|nr:uncharacterized protein N7471_011596 [Penicillium samsonianum]KAJ6124279.1 hypothetical protein N7471_011596 [Penicillium samsonianum]
MPKGNHRACIRPEFSYEHIIQEYGSVLDTQFEYKEDPIGFETPRWVSNKATLEFNMITLLEWYLRYAFRATFKHLAPELSERGLLPISFGMGYHADPIKTYSADIAFTAIPVHADIIGHGKGLNRLLGGLKCSWKWKSA